MTRQLATMISSGLSLMRALIVLESQTQNKRLRATVVSLRQDIESGASLSGALAKHPKIFSELFVAMIRAGETGGFLESALIRVADQLEAQHKLRRQVKSAMVYPAVVTSIAICVCVAMLVFIIPVFAGVFKQFNGDDAVADACTRSPCPTRCATSGTSSSSARSGRCSAFASGSRPRRAGRCGIASASRLPPRSARSSRRSRWRAGLGRCHR